LAITKPLICAAIVNSRAAVKETAPLVDLFEVRIDLVGAGWAELAKRLEKPWIACNRRAEEGGAWQGDEAGRTGELMRAIELGAAIVDIELGTAGVDKTVREIKPKAKCLLSCHNLKETPALDEMREIVNKQLAAGADICKVVTTANRFADNAAVLQLISDFPESKIISFAMGPLGHASRVLCPLAGGYLTYASVEEGEESAPGQITAGDLRNIYEVLK
jgi:3-dehydroquinate dehydratase type I